MQFTNCNLILSEDYSNLCNLINIHLPQNKEYIDLNLSYLIVNKLISNITNQSQYIHNFCEITLIGGSNDFIWEKITVPLIRYIHNRSIFIKINLQIDNINDLTEAKILFCHNNQINLITYITEVDEQFINKIIVLKPNTIFKYIINDSNNSQMFKNYFLLNKLNVKNLQFIYTNYNKDIIFAELNKIKYFVISNFKQNKIPLITRNLQLNFLKNILNDIIFEKQNLYKLKCSFYDLDKILINQYGNCFFCNSEVLNTKNKSFLGDYLSQNNIDLKKYYENKQNKCINCKLSKKCSYGCVAFNLNNSFYCEYNNYLYQICFDICNQFNQEKNKVFKQYMYYCLIKGLKDI